MSDPETCVDSDDGIHCECWWDGHDPCCYCGDNTAACSCGDDDCPGREPEEPDWDSMRESREEMRALRDLEP